MQIVALRAALKEVPEETKGNVEKKQARTYEELLAEQAEQEEVSRQERRKNWCEEVHVVTYPVTPHQCVFDNLNIITPLIESTGEGLMAIVQHGGWTLRTLREAALLQAEAPSDSDDEDEFVYNPLKLPLGYDGKPIPYWLYKLHGLNQVSLEALSALDLGATVVLP